MSEEVKLPPLPEGDISADLLRSPYARIKPQGISARFNAVQMREYATAAVLAERERCAEVCDALHDKQLNSMTEHNYHRFAAAAIRKG